MGLLLVAACHDARKQPPSGSDASMMRDAASDAAIDAGSEPRDTARAMAMLEPTVAAERGTNGPIALSGRADFWEHGEVVTLRLDIRACKPGAMYQVRVHEGSDCSERTLEAETWSAGEGIGMYGCTTSSSIIEYYARRADDDKPWAIGGVSSKDVIGHALTLSDVATGQPVTCGVIQRAPDAPRPETTDDVGPTVQIRGVIAGVCVFDRQVPNKTKANCPDYAAATACASTYCDLNHCIDRCATYVRCLAEAHGQDACNVAYTCEPTAECASCQSEVVRCEVDLCIEHLTCAEPPTPDGPCSKLRQCCSPDDEDSASCLDITKNLAQFGDAECQRLLDNWRRDGKPCPVD